MAGVLQFAVNQSDGCFPFFRNHKEQDFFRSIKLKGIFRCIKVEGQSSNSNCESH